MRILLILFIFISLEASSLKNKSIIYLFKNKYFNYLCLHRWQYINKYLGKREDLLSLVAYSCLKKHYLTYALDLAKAMRFTKEGRINSTYIISLFSIKNYILRYIMDNFDLSIINIPFIDSDDLGKIFILIKKQKPKVKNNTLYLNYQNIKIKVKYSIKNNTIILEFFKDDKLLKKDIYW